MTENKEDFIITVTNDEDNTTVITTSYEDEISKYENDILLSALKDYDSTKRQYSAYLKDKASNDTLTIEFIDELANGIHSDVSKVQTANNLIRRYIITDDIIGKTYESIESNVNTNYRLSYGDYSTQRNKSKKLDDVKNTVNIFNKQINLKQLIRESIPLTYAEGN